VRRHGLPSVRTLLDFQGRRLADFAFELALGGMALVTVLLVLLLAVSMLRSGLSALLAFGPPFLWTTEWNPVTHSFGVLPAIYGTLATSFIALLLAVPIGICSAVFLAEIAPRWVAEPISFLIEMLASIPSVILGLWGLFVLVPLVREAESFLGQALGFVPIFSGPAYGVGLLSAGLILAIMILPILTSVIRDILKAVPMAQREAMLALGGTQWETIARAVLPYARSGIVGAIILALGRALGETLAVSMVIGNTFQISISLFSPATTLSSLISTQFREADNQLYLSALIAAGFVLFGITAVVNVLARLILWRIGGPAVTR